METTDLSPTEITRTVTVSCWPEQGEISVSDPQLEVAYASFTTGDPHAGAAGDPSRSYTERALDAITRSEKDQEHLRFLLDTHGVPTHGAPVKLHLNARDGREASRHVLATHGFALDQTIPDRLGALIDQLAALPVEKLYLLLCDWIEAVERNVELGSIRQEQDSFLWCAEPSRSYAYANRVASLDLIRSLHGDNDSDEIVGDSAERAHRVAQLEIDAPIHRFQLGHLLRWLYFQKTEFADQPLLRPSALDLILIG